MSNQSASTLYNQHKALLEEAIAALADRGYYTPYPEHPKAYAEDANAEGKEKFGAMLNQNFEELQQDAQDWIGEEVSPFWQTGLGVNYPSVSPDKYISNAEAVRKEWASTDVNERAGILIESLERVKNRFFEIAYATMHTTGQSFMMSFQASGPHGNDRALEAVAMGFQELRRFPEEKNWVKPMGKFDLSIRKTWKAMPKGIGLVIGCSTFPTWNSVPGVYADLITGNPVIVKPHPKAILPMAIVAAELRNVLRENGLNPNIVQLAVDTISKPITKDLATNDAVRLIDYTGGNAFGDYIESLNKTTFTEKAGVNSVILDSVDEIGPVAQNIAFSASLYSGQMCTAPQNVFIAEQVHTSSGPISYDEVCKAIADAVSGLVNHPKMGAGTLGGIQNDATLKRVSEVSASGGEVILESHPVENPEFENARTYSPAVVKMESGNEDQYSGECFGPVLLLIKTSSTKESVEKAADLARRKGAITCLAFSTSEEMQSEIEWAMNNSYTPVSFNLKGAAFVNQHAAFSDFHVSGGNPAGNASFTNPEYINKRFVWVGNRYM
ncbi:phenylacetic acid degradation protein PaaN [bacterium]|nr:phenylacetic acid degradation protein PaaN [bacterium]